MTRDIRDRLAEAFWNSNPPGDNFLWHLIDAPTQERMRKRADDILAALPSVGLTINTLESPSQGGETTNRG